MRRDVRAYLWDIKKAADAISVFVAGLDAQIYAETEVVHSAVERKFEIIGEARGAQPSLPLGSSWRGSRSSASSRMSSPIRAKTWATAARTSPATASVS